MGYLVCEKCGGYYKLKEGERIEDFKGCQCGGKFKYINSLKELNSKRTNISNSENKSICPTCGSENKLNSKFCGVCGKTLKKPSNPIPDKKPDKSIKPFYCPNCGTENLRTSKTCISCGQSLVVIPKTTKLKANISDKLSKYKNKRTYSIIGTSIIVIAIIAFLVIWVPANVFANHYDDGYVSFDYPTNFNITPDNERTGELFASGEGGTITSLGGGTLESGYFIYINFLPINTTIETPINETVNQTVGIDSNGNNITSPVNITTNETQNVSINVLQTVIDNYTATIGKPKVSTKNDYTYYELSSGTAEGVYMNETQYATLIEKKNYQYFFVILLSINDAREPGSNSHNYDSEGYNAYKKIVNSFKLG